MKRSFLNFGDGLQQLADHGPELLALRLQELPRLNGAVKQALQSLGYGTLQSAILAVHRENPPQGLRGSLLVVVVANEAVASRLRMIQPQISRALLDQGLGQLSLKVRLGQRLDALSTAEAQTAALARARSGPRPVVPREARRRLLTSLGLSDTSDQAQDH